MLNIPKEGLINKGIITHFNNRECKKYVRDILVPLCEVDYPSLENDCISSA